MTCPLDPEELYRRAEGARALARRLVGDAHRAEDVVQEAMAVSISRVAPAPLRPGAWFKGVVRKLALRAHRDDARRGRRDRSAPPPRSAPDPADVVAQAELHRWVVDQALALEEPYRSTLLRRHFDGLSAAEIAREQGIPAATVRTRVRRALSLLRDRLDSEHGDRRTWALALAPLLEVTRPAPPPPLASAPVAAGVAVMSLKKIAIVVAVLVVCGVAWVAVNPTGGRPEPPEAPEIVAAAHDPVADLPVAPARGGNDDSLRGRLPVGGRVSDENGNAAAGVRVILLGKDGGRDSFETDEDGGFRHSLRPGRYTLVLDGGDRGALVVRNFLIDGAIGDDLAFTLKRPGGIAVLVTRDGVAPVSGVVVCLESDEFGDPVRCEDTTGRDGIARFTSLLPGYYALRARLPGGTLFLYEPMVPVRDELTLDVRVPETTVLTGVVRALDDHGPYVPGAQVTLTTFASRIYGRYENTAATDLDGRYEIRAPRRKSKSFTVRAEGWADWPPGNKRIEVINSLRGLLGEEPVTRDVTLKRAGPEPAPAEPVATRRLEGTVASADSTAVFGARVWVAGKPALEAFTDEAGHWVLVDVPRDANVSLRASMGRLKAIPVLVRGGESPEKLVLRLGDTGTVRGTITDLETGSPVTGAQILLRPQPGTGRATKVAWVDAQGGFLIEGVLPGTWTLVPDRYGRGKYLPPRPWEVSVVRGGEARVDLRLDPGEVFAGTVADEKGEPVHRAWVTVFGTPDGSDQAVSMNAKTDLEGAFRVAGLERGTYRVKVSARGFGTLRTEEIRGGGADLRLVLPRARRPSGR